MLKKPKALTFVCLFAGVVGVHDVAAQLLNTDELLRRLPEVEVDLDEVRRLPLDETEVLNDSLDTLAPVLGLGELPIRMEIPSLQGGVALVEVEVEGGWRAVEREWLLLAENAALDSFNWPGIQILHKQALPALDMVLLQVRVSEALDSYRHLQTLFADGSVELFDRNHVFAAQTSASASKKVSEQTGRKQLANIPKSMRAGMRIGMIDTAVSRSHPVLKGANIKRARFVEADIAEAEAHGTAVASLIVGRGEVEGLLPDAELYAASAFYSRHQRSQGATSLSLLQALDWLLAQNVVVINMSLAGPPNNLLLRAVDKAWAKGIAVVAAVGNAGPQAPPLYPAAWEKVIAVTAVDADTNIYRWAVQGEHVDFSARGVAVSVARIPDVKALESGTSLAAPIVTCLLATEIAAVATAQSTRNSALKNALDRLQLQIEDLGAPGRDKVFGYGYLHTQ